MVWSTTHESVTAFRSIFFLKVAFSPLHADIKSVGEHPALADGLRTGHGPAFYCDGETVNLRGRLDMRDKMSLPRRPGTMADVSTPQFVSFLNYIIICDSG